LSHNEDVTIREALVAAASRLSAEDDLRGTSVRDAELLLLHTAGLARTVLFRDPQRALAASEVAAYEAAIARRAAGEPIQYITGEQEFYGLALKVTPAVLIPRPETELLVESVLDLLPRRTVLEIVDVGTGSGAIAIALARHLPMAGIKALDLSEDALAIARENAARHHVEDRIDFVRSDLLEAVGTTPGMDAIVSNPPYIAAADRDSLHRQVRDHEPALALIADEAGLGIYRRLIPQAYRVLRPGGLLALEIGHGQSEAVGGLLTAWKHVDFLDDLQGIPRVVIAIKPAGEGAQFYPA
jgi:release factor glutamine methyltransferase